MYRYWLGTASPFVTVSAALSHVTSLLVVVLSLLLAVSLTCLTLVLRLHHYAFCALTLNHHYAFCFTFLYAFPHLVSSIIPWAPPWAPICLWYAFLVQLFCTQVRT